MKQKNLAWDPDADSAQRASRVVALGLAESAADALDRVRKRDPDSIHEFRIELRRLRSWLRVYEPVLHDTVRRRTLRRLRKIARATTEVRDIDVEIAWLDKEIAALGQARLEAAKWIVKSLRRERKAAWRKFRKVAARHEKIFDTKLARELTFYNVRRDVRKTGRTARMRPVTARLLLEQTAVFSRALHRIQSADDTKHLHRTRIIAKRLRYTLHALGPEFDAVPRAVEYLARFQDEVGELRDAQLLAHRVSREITTVVAERTALVASELVYRPGRTSSFTRVMTESPFDRSLSLLFARLHDRLSASARAVSTSLGEARSRDWVLLMMPLLEAKKKQAR
jgi:CHAD domain-containing protein